MAKEALAQTYARALKEAFSPLEQEAFFACVEELKTLSSVLEQEEVKKFFLSPIIPVSIKKQALQKSAGAIGDKAFSFLCVLLERKRWKLFPTVVLCLGNEVEEMQGVVTAEVESAVPLSAEFLEKLKLKLKSFFNKEICLEIKPPLIELVGGIRVYAKGLVFDDTLLFHLTRMENQVRRGFNDSAGK